LARDGTPFLNLPLSGLVLPAQAQKPFFHHWLFGSAIIQYAPANTLPINELRRMRACCFLA
jgi:hypothetical protein